MRACLSNRLAACIRVTLQNQTQLKVSGAPVVWSASRWVNLAELRMTRNGVEARLTAMEFKLPAHLAARAGRVLTHHAILSAVWGPEYAEHVEYLRVYMCQLRRKLEADPDHPEILTTEPGIGYRFMAEG